VVNNPFLRSRGEEETETRSCACRGGFWSEWATREENRILIRAHLYLEASSAKGKGSPSPSNKGMIQDGRRRTGDKIGHSTPLIGGSQQGYKRDQHEHKGNAPPDKKVLERIGLQA